MSEFHGNLLIGGMALKNVLATLERDESAPDGSWHGELIVDPDQNAYLESGRPYRLELEDGRAGKIVIKCVNCIAGEQTLRALFDGLSALEGRLPIPPRDDTTDVSL